jgi:hypothetical protein
MKRVRLCGGTGGGEGDERWKVQGSREAGKTEKNHIGSLVTSPKKTELPRNVKSQGEDIKAGMHTRVGCGLVARTSHIKLRNAKEIKGGKAC